MDFKEITSETQNLIEDSLCPVLPGDASRFPESIFRTPSPSFPATAIQY
jgi:hypothetical protein